MTPATAPRREVACVLESTDVTDVVLASPTPDLRDAMLALEPRDGDESVWAGFGDQMLPAAEADPTRFPLAIVARGDEGGEVVGMLTLDWGERSRRYAAGDEIGLHGVLVDRRQRGRGYGVAALRALPLVVVAEHPQAEAIALTVNVQNHPAIAAYLAAGFVDTGRLFLGGQAGPQHVFRRSLESFDPTDRAA